MPQTQPQFPLKQLVRAYTNGQIDRISYRARRARILDDLAAESLPESGETTRQASPGEVRHPPTEAASSNPPLALIVIIGAVALVIAALVFNLIMNPEDASLSGDSTTPQHEKTASATSPVAPSATSQKRALEESIKAFVKNNAWDDTNRRNLLDKWNEANPGVRDSVKKSYWFRALNTELRTLIKEEIGMSSPQSINRANTLMAFGTHLGLTYPEFSPE